MSVATRDAILNSAEHLFAESGVDGTSIRKIVEAADVNVASVNYHFGSKEKLVEAVLVRRISHVNDERMALLDKLQADAGEDQPLPLRAVLEAFVRPALTFGRAEGRSFVKLATRAHAEANELVRTVVFRELQPVIARFVGCLSKIFPNRHPVELTMTLSFAAGAMVHSALWMESSPFDSLLEGSDLTEDRIIDLLIGFCTAGLRGMEAK